MSDPLIHYGVKGMKWGVRKNSTLSRKESAIRNKREDFSARRRTLTDQDLDATIKRIKSEREMKQLIEKDLHPGRAFVRETISKSGPKVATAVVSGAMMYAVRGVITKQWGMGELASNIPKIKK